MAGATSRNRKTKRPDSQAPANQNTSGETSTGRIAEEVTDDGTTRGAHSIVDRTRSSTGNLQDSYQESENELSSELEWGQAVTPKTRTTAGPSRAHGTHPERIRLSTSEDSDSRVSATMPAH